MKAAKLNLIYLSSHRFSVIHSTTNFDEILLLPSETTLDSDAYLLTCFLSANCYEPILKGCLRFTTNWRNLVLLL